MKLNERIKSKISSFVINEIGGKGIDGVSYALFSKDVKDEKAYTSYCQIEKEAAYLDISPELIIRKLEVSNGYIVDINNRIINQVMIGLMREVNRLDESTASGNIDKDESQKQRVSQMKKLASHLMKEWKSGNTEVEVALFNTGDISKVHILGRKQGAVAMKEYEAFRVSHWDIIDVVNERILAKNGFVVTEIRPYEILPNKNGVRFVLVLKQHSSKLA